MQFEKSSKYYDASSSADAPKWVQVEVKLLRKLKRQVGCRAVCSRCSLVAIQSLVASALCAAAPQRVQVGSEAFASQGSSRHGSAAMLPP